MCACVCVRARVHTCMCVCVVCVHVCVCVCVCVVCVGVWVGVCLCSSTVVRVKAVSLSGMPSTAHEENPETHAEACKVLFFRQQVDTKLMLVVFVVHSSD